MLMKKDILWMLEAEASTRGSRVIALGDGPRGREPLDIFGPVLEYFSQYLRIFLFRYFWNMSRKYFRIFPNIFSRQEGCV